MRSTVPARVSPRPAPRGDHRGRPGAPRGRGSRCAASAAPARARPSRRRSALHLEPHQALGGNADQLAREIDVSGVSQKLAQGDAVARCGSLACLRPTRGGRFGRPVTHSSYTTSRDTTPAGAADAAAPAAVDVSRAGPDLAESIWDSQRAVVVMQTGCWGKGASDGGHDRIRWIGAHAWCARSRREWRGGRPQPSTR